MNWENIDINLVGGDWKGRAQPPLSIVFIRFPMVFPWFSYDFTMDFPEIADEFMHGLIGTQMFQVIQLDFAERTS